MSSREKFSVDDVREALLLEGGNVSQAAKRLGCRRQTVHEYMERYPELKEDMKLSKEKMLDIAEHNLVQKMRAGNLTAIIFYLKTQGKHRGYVERKEHAGDGGGPVQLSFKPDLSNLTPEQRKQLRQVLNQIPPAPDKAPEKTVH